MAATKQRWFGSHPEHSLVEAGVWAAAGNAGNALLGLGGTVVLSRLLDPAEVGLFALAFSFYSIPSLVIGPSLTEAAIRAPHLTQQQASNLLWINTGLNAAMAAVLVAFSPFLSELFHQPSLRWLCAAFGVVLVLEGIASQYRALIHRAMRFDLSAKVQLGVGAMSLGVAIVLAWLGYGVWALVAQVVVGAVLDRIALAAVVQWRPSWFERGAGIRSMVHYSWGSSLAMGLHLLYTQLQALLMGRFASVSDIGYYNRGQSLFQKPFTQLVGPIQAVLLPSLSSRQHDPAALGAAVHRANAILFTFLPPLALWMMISGRDLAVLLLGEQWRPAGEAVFWFAFAAIPGMFFGTLYKANLARGRSMWGLGIRIAFLPLLLAGLFWAAPRGATAMAAIGAAVEWVSAPVILWFLVKDGPVPVRYFGPAIAQGLAALALSAVALWALSNAVDSASLTLLSRIVSSLAACFGIGCGTAALFGFGRQALREVWAILSRALQAGMAFTL